jgi:hypothetical protein
VGVIILAWWCYIAIVVSLLVKSYCSQQLHIAIILIITLLLYLKLKLKLHETEYCFVAAQATQAMNM